MATAADSIVEEKRGGKASSLMRDAARIYFRNVTAVVGLAFIAIWVLAAILAPILTPYDPMKVDFDHVREPPSWQHWMGTDLQGRDTFCRMIYGARASLGVAFVSQSALMLIGMSVGSVAGYYGKAVDMLVMRTVDIITAFPTGLVLIILLVYLGPGFLNMILAMSLTAWVGPARLVRGEVLKLKQRDFVEAARMIGCRDRDIVFRHLFPNLIGPIVISFAMGFPGAIMTEASMSFMGIGLVPPTPSWGTQLNMGFQVMRSHPHMVLFPAVTISLTMMAFLFVGDGLRAAFDPHTVK